MQLMDRTPITQSYEDRMPAHANVDSMHGHYLNNLKETHYKKKVHIIINNTSRHLDECAEQRFETADGDNKRFALIDIRGREGGRGRGREGGRGGRGD